jgi:septal ring factor EnvC (AmiA/AmiB activator)
MAGVLHFAEAISKKLIRINWKMPKAKLIKNDRYRTAESITMVNRLTNSAHKFLLLTAGLFLLAGAASTDGSNTHRVGIVTAQEILVHAEPGRHGQLQKKLKRGTRVEIIKRHTDWLQIIHNGEVGFIRDRADAIKILPPPTTATEDASLKQQPEAQAQIDSYKERQKNLRLEIEKGRQEVKTFIRKENATIKHLNRVEQALNKSRKRAAELGEEIKLLDEKISQASMASEELKQRIQVNEEYVAKRLVAMYKMNWLGKLHLLASAGSMHEFIQRKAALEHILAYDEKIRRELGENQADLKKVLVTLETHKTQKKTRAAEYKEQIKLRSRERSTRQRLLADIRSQKTLELAAIDALTQAANNLDSQIKSLNSKRQASETEKNNSQLAFSAHKGLLIMPVNGRIISLFGPYKNQKYNITNFRSGIDIKAEKGEPIRSVFQGKVLYSSWFKGYGNMIIIDHGNNYYTIYAHLEETFKSKGDAVETHEVIATVGDTASMEGAKLYFEVRHHGKPENPLAWLKKG